MAWFPVAAAVVSTVMSFSGKMQAADAARQAGRNAQTEKEYEAAQLEQQAGQKVAASQRSAIEQAQHANLLASRAVAYAGASGGGITDPSVASLIADIQGEGAYRKGVKLYQGEEDARQLQMGAEGARRTGRVAAAGGDQQASAYETSAWGDAAKGAGTVYSRFGFGGPGQGTGSHAQNLGFAEGALWGE